MDIQALSVEEAVRLALEQLGRTRDQVKVEVLATDPNGDEVLVRVIAPDLPGSQSQEEASPRSRNFSDLSARTREKGRDRGDRASRPGYGDRGGTSRQAEPGNQIDLDEVEPGNEIEPGNEAEPGNRVGEGALPERGRGDYGN
ncbi:MAG: Jag N-terminal domain-containing protein, partial [Chloroflexota bacterium]|nr:Jag N-terminal domain-containing protein [Chloroflexota bacterium]